MATKRQRRLWNLSSPEDRQAFSRNVDNTRGAPLWGYNHYRGRMLSALLDDLVQLQAEGLDEDRCLLIQESLESFLQSTDQIGKARGGLFPPRLQSEVEKFREFYVKWNGINGRDPGKIAPRQKVIAKLKIQRERIQKKVSDLQYEISTVLDREKMAQTYAAVAQLILVAPGMFPHLARAYRDYQRRSGLVP